MKTRRMIFNAGLGALLISCLLMGVWIGCDKKGGLGPPSTVTFAISSMTASPSSIQTGGQASVIEVTVVGSDGVTPQGGIPVRFSATLGSIAPSLNMTDAAGVARTTLTSQARSGQATVTARLDTADVERSITIMIREVSSRITLEASALAMYANGISTTTITAVVFDSSGNPEPGVAVSFQTSAGRLLQTIGWTGADGEVMTTLVSAASQTDVVASVEASISGASARMASGSDAVVLPVLPLEHGHTNEVVTSSECSAPLATGKVVSSAMLHIAFIGVTIQSWADPARIAADETEGSTIKVNLKETETDIPIPNAQLFFGTDLGTIEGSALTDMSGVAEVLLTGGATPGTAHVRIYYGSLENTVTVHIDETSTATMVFHLNATPSSLDANGSSQAVITATLSDAERNNPVIGATIQFSTTLGTVTAFDMTDEYGVATATLTSSRQNGTATITASYAALSKSIGVQFKGVSLQVAANPANLIADSTTAATIVVTVKDAANLPIFGEPCLCISELGVFSASGLSQGPDTVMDETDVNGEVILYLRSKLAGTDVIRAAAAGATGSTTVHFTGYTFTLTPGRTEMTSGGDQTEIVAELKNSLGSPETGVTVTFATTLGSITFSGTTDANGQASAVLTSGPTSGTALITAHAGTPEGPVSSNTSVYFRSATAGTILLSADPKVVAVGGGKPGTATLMALVLDERQNPVANATVAFTLVRNPGNGEYIDPGTALTGVNGKAITSFVSGTIASDFEGIEIKATSGGSVESNIVRLTVAGTPDSVVVGYDTDSFTDNENGTYTLSVAAIVSDANGNPVVDGTWVYFSTTPNIGVVESPIQTSAGIASSHINYPASSVGDSVTLIAESGGIEGRKAFRLLGAAGIAKSVRLDVSTMSLLGDGQSVTTVDALVTDIDNRPVGGSMVTFSADSGKVTYVAFTVNDRARDDFGIAHAVYTSHATTTDFRDRICGHISGAQDCIEVALRGISIESNAYPDSIPADGASQSTITVVVEETTTKIPVTNSMVYFGTDLGTIVGSDLTDASGVATSTLTSGTAKGTAHITITFASILIAHDVVGFTRRDASQIILLSAGPDSIGVTGAGYNESATLVFEVRDDRGRPIGSDNPQRVRFTISGIPTLQQPEPFVFPADTVTDEFGRVSTTLNSGIKAGAVEVVASIGSSLQSTPVRIAIHGGPPDQDHFSVVPRWANIPGRLRYGQVDTMTAFVGDRYGNPVPTGTAVYFTTTGGIVQGSATTNSLGTASVVLYSADPMPYHDLPDPSGFYSTVEPYVIKTTLNPTGDGQAVVYANTVNGDGDPIWAHTLIVFSGSSRIWNVRIFDEEGVERTSLDIKNGGYNIVTFNLSDALGNPIARSMESGDLIRVRASTAAEVSEPLSTGVLMPDTRSGATSFSFMVSDKDAKETDPAQGCTASIIVNSTNNGDVYFSVSGRID